MQRLLSIAWLTWKAALRFRLFLVITVLLLASVVGLPLLLKDDGTARGFTQILLTYTLSTISALLGLSGASVFLLLHWRATRLPVDELKILRNEVLVSRASARESDATADIEAETDRQLKQRLAKNPVGQADLAEVRKQVFEQVKAVYQIVPP